MSEVDSKQIIGAILKLVSIPGVYRQSHCPVPLRKEGDSKGIFQNLFRYKKPRQVKDKSTCGEDVDDESLDSPFTRRAGSMVCQVGMIIKTFLISFPFSQSEEARLMVNM